MNLPGRVIISILSFLCVFVPIKAQKANPLSIGFQFNIGFNSLPDRYFFDRYSEKNIHCIPATFSMEVGYKEMWFAKVKLTNLSNTTWEKGDDIHKYDYDEFINMVHLAIGYNFFHEYLPEHLRLSFAAGPYIERLIVNDIVYDKKSEIKQHNIKLFVGGELTFRHEVGKNFALGVEADYGVANDVDKILSFSGDNQKIFCISALVSYTIRSK